MYSQFRGQNPVRRDSISRPIEPFPGVIPLDGRLLALSAALLSAILAVGFLLSLTASAGNYPLRLHPNSREVPGNPRSEPITSSSHANVPLCIYSQLQGDHNLSGSIKSADRYIVADGERLIYTIRLVNAGNIGTVQVSDPIPTFTTYVTGSARVTPSVETIVDTARHVSWKGWVPCQSVMTITFPVTVVQVISDGEIIVNTAWISYEGGLISLTTSVTVDAAGPDLWGCSPSESEWVTSTQTPTCTVQARDPTSGLDVSSTVYRYWKVTGWSDWTTATCTGTSNIALTQTCTAANVPFRRDSAKENQVEFKVSDVVGHPTSTTCTIPIDTAPPTFGPFHPQEIVTTTRTPTCTIAVSDITSGLNVGSVGCRYSADGGASWNNCGTVTCTGLYETKEPQWITATAGPFNSNGSTQNLIQFQISDVAGNFTSSPTYLVSISVPYTVYLPFTVRNYTRPFCNGDFEIIADGFAVCWERGGNLSVTITTTLSNNRGSCYSGTYCALLGSLGDQCRNLSMGRGQIHQTFGVPTGTPKLSFWYRIFSYDERIYDKHGFDRRDTFEVYIEDISPNNTPPVRLLIDGSHEKGRGCDKSNLDITPWKQSPVFDLSAVPDGNGGSVDYRGKAIRLSFRLYSRDLPEYSKAWYNTWVYVDDVRVEP